MTLHTKREEHTCWRRARGVGRGDGDEEWGFLEGRRHHRQPQRVFGSTWLETVTVVRVVMRMMVVVRMHLVMMHVRASVLLLLLLLLRTAIPSSPASTRSRPAPATRLRSGAAASRVRR